MTTFETERMARGWGLIAEGAMEISLAYSAIEPGTPPVPVPGPRSAPAVRAAGDAPSSLAAPSFDELPPEDFIPMKLQVEAGLGKCPVHGTAWTIKAAGVGKNGKPYRAFWRCTERDGSFCNQKPQPIWAQTHPAEAVA